MNDNHGSYEARRIGGRHYIMPTDTSLKVDGLGGVIVMMGLCFVIWLIALALHGTPIFVFVMCIAWLTLRGRREVKRYYFAAAMLGLILQTLVLL